jgi:hypothetical protein
MAKIALLPQSRRLDPDGTDQQRFRNLGHEKTGPHPEGEGGAIMSTTAIRPAESAPDCEECLRFARTVLSLSFPLAGHRQAADDSYVK